MSHFIQDNQAVVELDSGEIMLFIKGGDNNVTSLESNKRATSWHFQNIFTSKDDYDAFIEDLVVTDVSGGMWQFQSLKNKYFEGFLEYFATVFKRFEKAYNSRLVSSWKFEDVTVENIKEFEADLMRLLQEKNFSLKDQDGYEQDDIGIVTYYKGDFKTKEEYGFNVLQRKYISRKNLNGKVRRLCLEYEKITPKEALNDVVFCRKFVEADFDWLRGTSLLDRVRKKEITRNADFACFNILLNSSEKTVRDLLGHWQIEDLIRDFPSQFQTLIVFDSFQERAQKVLERERSKKYNFADRLEKNLKKLNEANYDTLIKELDEKITQERKEARKKFIKAWNSIEKESWYKNTNEKLPLLKKELDELYATNTFTLREIKKECIEFLDELIYNYNHQYKRNKAPIKKFTQHIIKNFSELIDDESLKKLCDFFKIEMPKQETVIKDEQAKAQETPQNNKALVEVITMQQTAVAQKKLN